MKTSTSTASSVRAFIRENAIRSFEVSVDIVEWTQMEVKKSRRLEEVLDLTIAGQCKHVQEEMGQSGGHNSSKEGPILL
ncbi:hypothetical protein V6N13_014799 [Hibiscus sabdariffa]